MSNERATWKESVIVPGMTPTQRQLLHSKFLRLLTMKVLVVTLALTIFAGSQAFVLRDEQKSKVAELEQELEQCFKNIFWAIYRNTDMVVDSEIFKAVSPWFRITEEKLQQLSKALEDAVPPKVKEIDHQLRSIYRVLENKVFNEMHAFGRHVHDEMEAFHEALKSDLDPILEKLDPYTQPLHQSFMRTCGELDEKLTEMLKPPLEKLQPLAKELPSLQEVQDFLHPIFGWLQKSITEEAEKAHDALQQSAARVLGVLNKYTDTLNQWVQSPIFPEEH